MTPPRLQVVVLREEQAEEAGAVTARAFQDEPIFMYALPDPGERASVLHMWFARGLACMCRFSEPPQVTEPLLGTAIWLPPAGVSFTDEQLAAVGFDQMLDAMGAAAFERLTTVSSYCDARLHEAIGEPFWCLDVLAVDPPHQGRGIGGMLVSAMLERIDSEGLPSGLFSFRERNIGFYQRHGYEVVYEGAEPTSGLVFRGLRRAVAST